MIKISSFLNLQGLFSPDDLFLLFGEKEELPSLDVGLFSSSRRVIASLPYDVILLKV